MSTPGRRHGLGSIYRRGRIWWIQVYHRNKSYCESSRSTERSDAVRLLRTRLADLGRGGAPASHAERLDFEDLASLIIDDYLANQRRSIGNTRRSLAHLRLFFGRYPAIDITADRISSYIKNRRQEGAAPSTIRGELAALKRAIHLAVRAGKLPQRPIFPTIEVRNTRTGFFEEEELRAVTRHLPSEVKAVAEFMYFTGWRKGEVLNLQWRQVDLRAGIVRLEPGTTKNDEGRSFPVRPLAPLAALIAAQRRHTDDMEHATKQAIPWVFHRAGKRIKSFRAAWKTACSLAGLPNRIPHDFRRTAVRNLERAGVSRSVAMKLTGHKTESIYRRYAIVSEADLAEGVAKLSRLHEPDTVGLDAAHPMVPRDTRTKRRRAGALADPN